MKHHGKTNMLEGPIWKGLISFAIPIFLGNLFQQMYNTADTLIVGNFLGKEALAAVGSSANLIHLMIGLLQGIAMGGGVLIAKYYGAKDQDNLQKAVHTGIAFGMIGGLLLTVVGVGASPVILRWMGTPADVLPESVAYFRTYFFGGVALFLYNISTGILQNVGDSRHPLYYLILSSAINVVLDLVFVGVFRFGVASAALATVISQAVSAVLCLRQLMRTDDVYRVELRRIRFHGQTFRDIIRFGLPSGVQNSMISIANVVVQANINAFGANAMAGCGAHSKIEGFAFLPVTCFALGLSTFVGQNLGAKQYDRVKKGTRFGMLCCLLLSEAIGALLYVLSPHLIALFNSDPEVIAYGVMQCRVVSLFYCLMALSHCVAGIMRGAGKATVPMVVMLSCWCLFRVAYIAVMVDWFRDIRVVFSAYPVTWSLSTVIFLIYYFKGDWIHTFDKLEQRKHA